MKHFLDTSIARKMLLGSLAYRRYLSVEFGSEPCYASSYVGMEIKRSFLRNVIAFYMTLQLPTIQTVADAIAVWSDKFKTSETKAILQLIAELVRAHALDLGRPEDKRKVLQSVGFYIIRFDAKLRRQFKDPGKDTAHCARAEISLKVKEEENLSETLDAFSEAFDDVESCRNKCNIDGFFLNRYRTHVERYLELAGTLPKNAGTHGFLKIVENLREVLDGGSSECSCKRCEAVGDAVIALDAPREMQLEHLDRSFNHLCPPLKQVHKQHPSEAAITKPSQT